MEEVFQRKAQASLLPVPKSQSGRSQRRAVPRCEVAVDDRATISLAHQRAESLGQAGNLGEARELRPTQGAISSVTHAKRLQKQDCAVVPIEERGDLRNDQLGQVAAG